MKAYLSNDQAASTPNLRSASRTFEKATIHEAGSKKSYSRQRRGFGRISQRAAGDVSKLKHWIAPTWLQISLFLRKDELSPNFEILTSYHLSTNPIMQMEMGRAFDEFKGQSKRAFIETVRNVKCPSSQSIE